MTIEHVPKRGWSRDNGQPFFRGTPVSRGALKGGTEGELSAVIVINWFAERRDHRVN